MAANEGQFSIHKDAVNMERAYLLGGVTGIIEKWQAAHEALVKVNWGGLSGECLKQIKKEIEDFFQQRGG